MKRVPVNLLKETLDGQPIEEFAKQIAWAKICVDIDNEQRVICLEPEHTEDGAIEFLKKLDFEYDNDFGWQEVYGTIMFNDSTWIERREYDGSEWWEFFKVPDYSEIIFLDL